MILIESKYTDGKEKCASSNYILRLRVLKNCYFLKFMLVVVSMLQLLFFCKVLKLYAIGHLIILIIVNITSATNEPTPLRKMVILVPTRYLH